MKFVLLKIKLVYIIIYVSSIEIGLNYYNLNFLLIILFYLYYYIYYNIFFIKIYKYILYLYLYYQTHN